MSHTTQTTKGDVYNKEGEMRSSTQYAADASDPTASSRVQTGSASGTIQGEFTPAAANVTEKTTVPVTTTYETKTAPVDVKMGSATTKTENVTGTKAEFVPAGATSYEQKTVPVTTTYETSTKPVDVKMGTSTTRELGAPEVHLSNMTASSTMGLATSTTHTTGGASVGHQTDPYTGMGSSSVSTTGTTGSEHRSIGERLREGMEEVKDKVKGATSSSSSSSKYSSNA